MGVDLSIQAVVFDLDGLLLDTERVYLEAYHRACRALDVQGGEDAYIGLIGLNSCDLSSALEARLGAQKSTILFMQAWSREITALFEGDVPVKAGVHALCTHLSEAGIPRAIATNSDANKALERLARAGLGEFFSVLVGGDQVEHGKPAPDMYLEAARRLNADPKKTVAFEDSDTGVRAALAAGMITVQVPDLQQPGEEVRSLGHRIAPDILTAARDLGLFRR